MQNNKEQDRSLGELFRDLSREILGLVRHEIEFAKTEVSQKVSHAGKDIRFVAIGGAIAFAGFLAILAAVVIWLGSFMPMWGAAMLAGIVLVLIGFLMFEAGIRRLKREEMKLEQTVEMLKEDSRWLKSQVT